MTRNFLVILLLNLFYIISLCAQDSLQITALVPMAGGTYNLEINDKKFRAIPEELMKKFLQLQIELEVAKKQNVAKDSLLSAYQKTDMWYEKLLGLQKTYTSEMESILQGYKGLITDYKKMNDPWLYISAGLGASGPDTKPSVLFGLGIRSVRLWGIFQERNSGVLFGTELSLF